jgi:hypothetical protein
MPGFNLNHDVMNSQEAAVAAVRGLKVFFLDACEKGDLRLATAKAGQVGIAITTFKASTASIYNLQCVLVACED